MASYPLTANGPGPSNDTDNSSEYYKEKLKVIKKLAKDYVFFNAAICDQVAETQEKLLIAKEKRRYYFNKLQSTRAQFETTNQLQTKPNQLLTVAPQLLPSIVSEPVGQLVQEDPATVKPAKKRPKLKKSPVKKRCVDDAELDQFGQAIFPLRLGNLTVHSLGQVIADQPDYLSEKQHVRVGYYSTRIYAHLDSPEKKCVYRCKVLSGDGAPRFQIVADVMDVPFNGSTASECHDRLIRHINSVLGSEVLPIPDGLGPHFFGFCHPTTMYYMKPPADRTGWAPLKEDRLSLRVSDYVTAEQQKEDARNLYEFCEPSLSFEALQRSIVYSSEQYQVSNDIEEEEEEEEETEEILGEQIEHYGTWIS